MERRIFLAMILSLGVTIAWLALVSHLYPIEKQRVINGTAIVNNLSNLASEDFSSETPRAEIWRNNILFIFPYSASINKVFFKDYNAEFILNKGFLCQINATTLSFQPELNQGKWYFVSKDENKKIIKEFIFNNSNNTIELRITIQNLQSYAQKMDFLLLANQIDWQKINPQETRFQEIYFSSKTKDIHLAPRKNYQIEKIDFLGFRDRYFCLIIQPQDYDFQGVIQKIDNQKVATGLMSSLVLPAETTQELKFLAYLGPQDQEQIKQINPHWTKIIHYGTFNSITYFLLEILKLFYKVLKNWGLAIITLSIVIYFLLYPLTLKQLLAMKKMQILQPQIEELKKLYSQNPQRLNKEIIELYRREKVNPLGGCLPLLLQIPIFFALYQGLSRFLALKGKSFLWIKDLAEPDKFTTIGGQPINLLPLLLILIMFLQQKQTQAMSSSQTEQQKALVFVFPVILGIIFYSLPAGLVLYWLVNSLLMWLFQMKIK